MMNTPHGIDIVPVTSRRDRRDFLNLPRRIYANDPVWVEPLRIELSRRLSPKHNSYLRHNEATLLLAYRDGEVVGRISAQIDRLANPGSAPLIGNFGLYESIDDADVAAALFAAAENWLRARGAQKMVGPYNFRLEDPAPGFLSHGFDERPTFMMPYSKPYYLEQARAAGLTPIMQLNSYAVTKERPLPAEFLQRADDARQISGMAVRSFNMSQLNNEAEILRGIFNESLKDNWGHVPMTSAQARGMARNLKQIADPRIVLIAEVAGRPIGAVINLPNLNDILHDCRGQLFPKGLYRLLCRRRDIRGLRGYALAILPEYQGRGVGCLLVTESWARGEAAGYTYGEITWILGSNAHMNELARGFGGQEAKRYCLMEKSLV